ncbi:hypothetical protein [Massilia psychrophila]|uniref:Uncharacterized protein n=1 Tax=Massilia psychrophila TaxID=1603353 RepID=A0A2G8T4U8_9BURK|nr:hypothetical protein [Massilia psychrophila]PIL40993.1 hypothetical protein CR103_04475 [Massilia psychrophila]GGE68587.1 hypothetical protein GCM10008020_11260 [Massilia psychrophila]
MQHMQHMRVTAPGNNNAWLCGVNEDTLWRFHSTPDPDAEPPAPNPNPDDVPPPTHAPVQEPPSTNEPPIKARRN